jgi:hypothetical protein
MTSTIQQMIRIAVIASLGAACAHSRVSNKIPDLNEILTRLVTCPGPLPGTSECRHSKIKPLTKQVWMIEGSARCFQSLVVRCVVEENQKQVILDNQSTPAPSRLLIPKK